MKKNKTTPFDVFLIIFLGAICIVCVLPFIHLLAVSFSDNAAVSAGKVGFLPVGFTLASYEYVIKGAKFFRAMGISLIRVALGTLLNLALILPGALPVYNMIILMNFIRGLPKELEEAAWIDGATPFQTLTMVIFPLLGPSLATVGLFQMVFHWNDWFSGLIYMSNPNLYPLQTYLQTLLVNFEQLLQSSGNGADITAILSKMNARTGRAAQLFLGALPIMMVYPFLQKYFTKGLTLGSVKG